MPRSMHRIENIPAPLRLLCNVQKKNDLGRGIHTQRGSEREGGRERALRDLSRKNAKPLGT